MEAYHYDEHKGQDLQLLVDRLCSHNTDGEKAEHVRISLFIEPMSLNNRKRQTLLETLTKEDNIRLFVIDELHFISQSGRNFRPEFKLAIKFLGDLLRMMSQLVPRILLSATMLKSDIYECTDLLCRMKPNVLHSDLSRQDIMFRVIISGKESTSLKKSARLDFEESSQEQDLWYTILRTKAEGSLRDLAEDLLEVNPDSVAPKLLWGRIEQ